MNAYPKWLRDAASRGGKATGAAKRRGDSAHYKRLSRKAAKARKAKSPNDQVELSRPGGDGSQQKEHPNEL